MIKSGSVLEQTGALKPDFLIFFVLSEWDHSFQMDANEFILTVVVAVAGL